MDRSKEKVVQADKLTFELLEEGIVEVLSHKEFSLDKGETEIEFFVGDPNLNQKILFTTMGVTKGSNDDPDKVFIVLEPSMENMVQQLERMMGLVERPDGPSDLDGELGMKPPTEGETPIH